MATGPNFAPPLPLMQPPACRLLDPPNSPPIDPFLADRLRNHRHLAIAPWPGNFIAELNREAVEVSVGRPVWQTPHRHQFSATPQKCGPKSALRPGNQL